MLLLFFWGKNKHIGVRHILKIFSPFFLVADPDPAFHFNDDPVPDPAPLRSDGMRRWAQLIDRPSMALLWAYTALPRLYFELLKLFNFVFNADPDPDFNSNADPDPIMRVHADPHPQPCFFQD
jgi:hypothetical protein